MKIWWRRSISNEELLEKCYELSIANEIRKRKWSWIGHTQRKPSSESCRQALEWALKVAYSVGDVMEEIA